MQTGNVYNQCLMAIAAGVCLIACTDRSYNSIRKVNVIQPIQGKTCGYQIVPAALQTLDNLSEMRGRVGKVVTTKLELDSSEELLNTGAGFIPVDTQFIVDGDTATPVDLSSLFTASLYYAVESTYLLFRNLDPKADLALFVPGFSDTMIVYNARAKEGQGKEKKEVYDNAEYLAHRPKGSIGQPVKNYFFAYPNKDVKDIPLGLNVGVLAHEYTHMVFHHLFLEPGIQRNTLVSTRDGTRPTEQTITALDEGIADYFGFMMTKDPGFLLCSFPFENRNLSVAKEFTEDVVLRLERTDSSFDPHESGAVFAAIQYAIGEAIKSHETNATTLIRMMSRLLECPEARVDANTLGFDFADVAKCHLREYVDGTQQAAVRSVYERYLGFRYKGR